MITAILWVSTRYLQAPNFSAGSGSRPIRPHRKMLMTSTVSILSFLSSCLQCPVYEMDPSERISAAIFFPGCDQVFCFSDHRMI